MKISLFSNFKWFSTAVSFCIFSLTPMYSYAMDTTNTAAAGSSAATTATATAGAAAANVKLDASDNPSGMSLEVSKQCAALAGPHLDPAVAKAVGIVEVSCQKAIAADELCFGVFSATNKWCHTEKNENIVSSLTVIQGLMSAASGITNACNNFAKAMDIAKKAMALYTTACTAAQVACNTKCGGALGAVKTLASTLKTQQAAITTACTAAASNNPGAVADCNSVQSQITALIASVSKEITPEVQPTSVATKEKICKVDVLSILGTAIINIGSLAQSQAQADQCKKDAEIAAKSCDKPENKNNDNCIKCELAEYKDHEKCKKIEVVVCDQPENQDKPICICKANPRAVGCEGISTSLATLSNMNTGGTAASSRTPSGNIATNSLGATTATDAFPKSKSGSGTDGSGSSSSMGGGGGGSSAGLSGSSAAVDGNKKDKASDASKLSANILDSGSGGGGGGYRGSYGGDYASANYRDQLKKYANKNGIKAKLAGNSWSDQVTGTGGKSNFDKVKTRYQENKSSLLNK